MSSGILSFVLQLKTEDFTGPLKSAGQGMADFTQKSSKFSEGLKNAEHETLGLREKSEILRTSLEQMGGPLGRLAGLSRMALDPMTMGFAAVFAGFELYNQAVEHAEQLTKDFDTALDAVGESLAKVTQAMGNMPGMEQAVLMATTKANESPVDFKTPGDRGMENLKSVQEAQAQAAQQAIDLQKQQIQLQIDLGKISEQTGAARIANLEKEAALQKAARERSNLAGQIAYLSRENTAIGKQVKAYGDLTTAAKNKYLADKRLETDQAKISSLPETIQKLREAQSKAFTAGGTDGRIYGQSIPFAASGKDWTKEYADLGKQIAEKKAEYNAARADLGPAMGNQQTQGRNLSAIESGQARQKELEKQIGDLTARQKTLRVTQGITLPGQLKSIDVAAALSINKESRKMEFGPGKMDGTQFEKMGFVMGGRTDLGVQYQKQAAESLKQLVSLLGKNPAAGASIGTGMVNLN